MLRNDLRVAPGVSRDTGRVVSGNLIVLSAAFVRDVCVSL